MKSEFVNRDFKKRVTKKAVMLFIPLLLLVSILTFFKYRAERDCRLNFIGNSQSQYLLQEEKLINDSFAEVLNDLHFFSGLELVVPAISERDYSRAIAEDIILKFIGSRNNYDRIMISGPDDEVKLSVENNGGDPYVVSGKELEGLYLDHESGKGLRLKDREIFISVLIPEDQGEVSSPSCGVVRFAMNLNDHLGDVKGTVAAEYLLEDLRSKLEPFPSIPGFNIFLFDSTGEKLNLLQEQFSAEERITEAESALIKGIDQEVARMFESSNHSSDMQFYRRSGLYSFAYVDPAFSRNGVQRQSIGFDFRGPGKPPWILSSFIPSEYIHEKIMPLKKSNLLIFTLLAFIMMLSCVISAFAYEKRKKESLVDPLTSLWNRRFFLQKIDKLQQELDGGKTRACLALIDLGNFKEINDNLGHKTGDDVLKKVGQILRENLRINDEVARYGGDEFIVFLPRTDKIEALMILERVRKKILHVTVSETILDLEADYGVGEYPVDSSDLMEILDIADEEMYSRKKKRKESGKRNEKLELGCTC